MPKPINTGLVNRWYKEGEITVESYNAKQEPIKPVAILNHTRKWPRGNFEWEDKKSPEDTFQEIDTQNFLGDWDSNVSNSSDKLGPAGEPLPYGATAWDANGNPYYGDGLKGLANQFASQLKAPMEDEGVTEEQLADIGKAFGDAFSIPVSKFLKGEKGWGEYNRKDFADGWKRIGSGFSRIGGFIDSYMEGGIDEAGEDRDKPTIFTHVGRVFKAGVSTGLAGLDELAIFGERAALQVPLYLQTVAEASDIEELPINNMGIPLSQKWIKALKAVHPVHMGWNAYRASTVFSNKPKSSYDDIKIGGKIWDETWQTGRMGFTALGDATAKEEFVSRYKAGANPDLLARELEDPWMELAARLAFDPLNFAGFATKPLLGAVGSVRKMSAGAEFADVADNILDAVKAVENLDDATAATRITEAVTLHMDEVAKTVGNMDDLRNTRKVMSYTDAAKQFDIQRRAGTVTDWVFSNASDNEEAFDAIKAMIQMASGNEDEVAQGMMTAIHFSGGSNPLLARGGRESGILLREIMTDSAGKFNPRGFIGDLTKMLDDAGGDISKVTEWFNRKTIDASKDLFPTVPRQVELADEAKDLVKAYDDAVKAGDDTADALKAAGIGSEQQLARKRQLAAWKPSPVQRFFANVDATMRTNPMSPYAIANRFFSTIYMGLSPGFAMRNMIQNTVHVLIDQGAGAWGRGTLWRPDAWVDITENWLVRIPRGMKEGIGATIAASEGIEITKNPLQFFLRLSETMEKKAAMRVVGKTVDDAMRMMLKPGRAIPHTRPLVEAGFSVKEINYLSRLLVDNYGDVGKARKAFVTSMKDGFIDAFRAQEWITPQLDDAARAHGLRLGDIMDEIETREDFNRILDEMIEGHQNATRARNTETVGAQASFADNVDDGDYSANLAQAISDGDIRVARGTLRSADWQSAANNFAMQEIRNAWKDLALEAGRKVDGTPAELTVKRLWDDSSKQMDMLSNKLLRQRETTKDNLWIWTRELKRTKRADTPAKMAEVWDKLNTGLDLPPNTTKQEMIDWMWNTYYRAEFKDLTTAAREGNMAILVDVSRKTGVGDSTRLKSVYDANLAGRMYDDVVSDGELMYSLQNLVVNSIAEGKDVSAVRAIANHYGFGPIDVGTRSDDAFILDIVRTYIDDTVNTIDDVSVEMVWNAGQRRFLDEKGYSIFPGTFDEWIGRRVPPEAQQLVDDLRALGGEIRGAREGVDIGLTKEEIRGVSETFLGGELENLKSARSSFKAGLIDEPTADLARSYSNTLRNFSEPGADASIKQFFTEDLSKFPDEVQKAIEDIVRNAPEEASKNQLYNEVADALDNFVSGKPLASQPAAAAAPQTAASAKPDIRRAIDTMEEFFGETEDTRKLRELLDDETIDMDKFDEIIESMSRSLDDPRTGLRAETLDPVPPPIDTSGAMPTAATMAAETRIGFEDFIETVRTRGNSSWGQVAPFGASGDDALRALDTWLGVAKKQIGEARITATALGDAARKFTLHDYARKRNLDLALSYIFPYQFWYSRTYKNWITRIATNPEVIGAYAQYRRTLETIHAGAPDWWKYQVNTGDFGIESEFLGIDKENPLFFNLEATLNPLNGISGSDFNDPERRVNWWTNTLDDIGKFGPTVFTPINLATATGLYMMGEEEAASRWGSRLIPQTETLKSIGAVTGLNIPELDPNVHIFSGGMDPWERRRVGRALGMMVENDVITREQAEDAAFAQDGQIWRDATLMARRIRGPGQLASFFLGVGFKGRPASDLHIDMMYRDMYRLWNAEETMDPEQFRREYEALGQRYTFMDSVLLSRKAGPERDRTFAYSVLGRIPPGQTNDIASLVGLTKEEIGEFYDAKGRLWEWDETTRQRFMAGVVDLGGLLALPDNATASEWTEARIAYKRVVSQGESLFGEDIWDRVDYLFMLKNQGNDDSDLFREAIDANPQLQIALDWKSKQIMDNPFLMQYYGGLDTIEKYYTGAMYQKIEREMPGISDEWEGYNQAKELEDQLWEHYNLLKESGDKKAANAFYKANLIKENRPSKVYWEEHPNLQRYIDLKEEWTGEGGIIEQALDVMGKGLKDPQGPFIREDVQGTLFQNTALEQLAPTPQRSWSEYQGALTPQASRLMVDYFQGDSLPDTVRDQLDLLVENGLVPSRGGDVDDLISDMQRAWLQSQQR